MVIRVIKIESDEIVNNKTILAYEQDKVIKTMSDEVFKVLKLKIDNELDRAKYLRTFDTIYSIIITKLVHKDIKYKKIENGEEVSYREVRALSVEGGTKKYKSNKNYIVIKTNNKGKINLLLDTEDCRISFETNMEDIIGDMKVGVETSLRRANNYKELSEETYNIFKESDRL